MSEWWTYALSDFLLFAPRTYYRLFELYNRASLAGAHPRAGGGRRGARAAAPWRRGRGRAVAAILAACWVWVAWGFHFQRYATINWAATWFAAAFAIEAALLAWTGAIRGRLQLDASNRTLRRAGAGMVLFALVVQPLIGPLAGRDWVQAELFGLAPDPTAAATLGALLLAAGPVRWELLLVPLAWCAVTGATLWAMRAPDALVMPLAGLAVLALSVWRSTGR